jgi:hypothetical protein
MNPEIRCSCLVALLAIASLGMPKCALGQNANSSVTPAHKVLAHQLAIATGRVEKQQYEQWFLQG